MAKKLYRVKPGCVWGASTVKQYGPGETVELDELEALPSKLEEVTEPSPKTPKRTTKGKGTKTDDDNPDIGGDDDPDGDK